MALNENLTTEGCDSDCPVRQAAMVLDGKWTTQIVRDLLGGKKRFSELLRTLNGVSPKVLTVRLKMLENHKLISKTIYPVVPPKTEYELTELGLEMKTVIVAMANFGELLSDAQSPNNT
ncbi:MAG: DNA-binding HxlR family transcriptional regulator [Halocynthiibacter sp.]|jgi:DNA-binding HxlR family transcriptional regulator